MAAGSSAPELFTSLADTFYFHSSVGVGTIVGSAVFNILVIIALSGACAGQDLFIDWRPLTRDIFFYLVSIAMLFVFCYPPSTSLPFHPNTTSLSLTYPNTTQTATMEVNNDLGYVTKWESLGFVLWYMLYILFMVFNDRFFAFLGCGSASTPDNDTGDIETPTVTNPPSTSDVLAAIKVKMGERADSVATHVPSSALVVRNPICVNQNAEPCDGGTDTSGSEGGAASQVVLALKCDSSVAEAKKAVTGDVEDEVDVEDEGERTWMDGATSVLFAPWNVLFSYTIPNCASSKWEKFFAATFVMSCVWIGLLSWLLVYCATEFGNLAHIDSVIMGVVVLAAGTSVPDAISSIVVAKEGKGSMAVANAIGSNVFDICLGIGLPYLISTGFMGRPPVVIATNNLKLNMVILVGTVVTVGATLAMSGWRLTKRVSWVLLSLYLAFVAFNLLDPDRN
jgi:K+-dependent Na+/Ca+ exchanger-like protein